MNKFLLIILALSFASTQLKALTCGASCSVMEKEIANTSQEHDCCPNSKSRESESKEHSEDYQCFHEVTLSDKVQKQIINVSVPHKHILAYRLPKISYSELKYLKHSDFDDYKIQKQIVKLFILKDQFLI